MDLKLTGNKKEKFLQKFTRIGLTAKGIVYCLAGILALTSAMGLGRHKDNKEEAFKMIYEQPFGEVLLVIISVSLLGFVTLRFYQAVLDSEHKGKGVKAIFRRMGLATSGLIYLGLSIYAFKLVLGDSGGGDSKKMLISGILEYPGGQLIIGVVAAIIIGQGIYQVYKGVSKKFMKKVHLYHSNFEGTFKKTGIVGHAARGIVLCIIGYLFLRAALSSNADQAGDTDGAFNFLQNTVGNVLMGTVALGFIAYGVFMFVRARHEKIQLS